MKLVVGLAIPAAATRGLGTTSVGPCWRSWPPSSASAPQDPISGRNGRGRFEGEKAILLTPWTYMNLSGGSALAARDFYKIQNEDLLVVCDDLNLPVAKLRIRSGGASEVKRIGRHYPPLGSDQFPGCGSAWERRRKDGLGRLRAQQVFSGGNRRRRIGRRPGGRRRGRLGREGVDACMNQYN